MNNEEILKRLRRSKNIMMDERDALAVEIKALFLKKDMKQVAIDAVIHLMDDYIKKTDTLEKICLTTGDRIFAEADSKEDLIYILKMHFSDTGMITVDYETGRIKDSMGQFIDKYYVSKEKDKFVIKVKQ